MRLQKGDARLSQAFQGTIGPDEGGGERSEEMGDRVFEEVGNGMSGGRGKEDDVEGYQVGPGPALPGSCAGQGV